MPRQKVALTPLYGARERDLRERPAFAQLEVECPTKLTFDQIGYQSHASAARLPADVREDRSSAPYSSIADS